MWGRYRLGLVALAVGALATETTCLCASTSIYLVMGPERTLPFALRW